MYLCFVKVLFFFFYPKAKEICNLASLSVVTGPGLEGRPQSRGPWVGTGGTVERFLSTAGLILLLIVLKPIFRLTCEKPECQT